MILMTNAAFCQNGRNIHGFAICKQQQHKNRGTKKTPEMRRRRMKTFWDWNTILLKLNWIEHFTGHLKYPVWIENRPCTFKIRMTKTSSCATLWFAILTKMSTAAQRKNNIENAVKEKRIYCYWMSRKMRWSFCCCLVRCKRIHPFHIESVCQSGC